MDEVQIVHPITYMLIKRRIIRLFIYLCITETAISETAVSELDIS